MTDYLKDVLVTFRSMVLKETYLQKVLRTELTQEKLLKSNDSKLRIGVRDTAIKTHSSDKCRLPDAEDKTRQRVRTGDSEIFFRDLY